jgi:hypothetical protein
MAGIEIMESTEAPQLPPGVVAFDNESRRFYDRILKPGLVAIAAITGGFKTALMCNVAAHAIESGRRPFFFSMEMPRQRIANRILSVLMRMHHREIDNDPNVLGVLDLINAHLKGHDASTKEISADDIAKVIDGALKLRPGVVVLDGIESVKREKFGAQDIVDVLDAMMRKASATGIPVLFSSQLNRDSDGREIPDLGHLSLAAEKGQRPDRVVMLGRRTPSLLTACVVKERNEPDDRDVYRLKVHESLRLDVQPQGHILPAKTPKIPDAVYISVPDEDLPKESSDAADDAEAEFADEDTPDIHQPTMQPYHGTAGFVGINRAFFSSVIFTHREAEDVFRVIDIYQMAQFEPKPRRAPGTSQSVQLKRGELLTSIPILARRWQVTPKVVRTFLNRAAIDGLIRQEVVDADGNRLPPESQMGRLKGMRRRWVGQVLTCLHYVAKESSDKHGKPRKGTSKGVSTGTSGAHRGHAKGTLPNNV